MSVRTVLRRWGRTALDHDTGRSSLVAVVALMVFLPAMFLMDDWLTTVLPATSLEDPFELFSVLLFLGVYWILYSVIYILVTLWWFSRLDSGPFHQKLRTTSAGPPRNRGWLMKLMSSDGTVSLSLQMCLLALIYTVVVMTTPEVRAEFGMRLLAVGVSVVNWVTVVVIQALTYARLAAQERDPANPSITFPGTPHPTWADYMTLAVGVSTMLGPADAQLSGGRARRTLQSHALVSFAFNSMVIASLATLMLS